MSMTDEQIVKAFEKCIDVTSGCCGDDTTCPYCTDEEEGCAKCFEKLRIDVLALIKRQQAEIEDLKADKEALINGQLTIQKMYIEARDKAVREFAERLKANASRAQIGGKYDFEIVTTKCIDYLVKEMTEKEGGKG